MIRKALVTAAAGIAIIAASSFAPSRANAMPMGLPAAAIDQIDITEAVALCFYIDGWNGPGMYQCGYRMRRGYGWHGARSGGRVVVQGGSYRSGSMHHGGGGKHGGGKGGGGGHKGGGGSKHH
jgi:uncharacterized membrane protein YgcG